MMDDFSRNQFHTKFSPFTVQKKIISGYGKRIPDSFRPDLRYNTLLRHLVFRNMKNMASFIAVVGQVRTGKSYFCLTMAEQYMRALRKEFNVEEQCSFQLLPFLKWSQTNKDSCYVFDEIELTCNPRQWFNLQNKVFNAFSDIQGLRRNVLFMPFPNITYIDKHLRGHITYIARTLTQGKVRLYIRKTFPEKEENPQSYRDPIGTITFGLPSKKTIDNYEAKKKIFTDTQLKEDIEVISKFGSVSEQEMLSIEFRRLRNENLKQKINEREMFSKPNQSNEDFLLGSSASLFPINHSLVQPKQKPNQSLVQSE